MDIIFAVDTDSANDVILGDESLCCGQGTTILSRPSDFQMRMGGIVNCCGHQHAIALSVLTAICNHVSTQRPVAIFALLLFRSDYIYSCLFLM